MKKLWPYIIGVVTAGLLTATAVYGASYFNSTQLAPSPQAGYCVTTDGANPGVNSWSPCGTGGGGGAASASLPSLSIQYNGGSGNLAGSANLLFTGGNAIYLNGTINATTSKFTNSSSTNLSVSNNTYLGVANSYLAVDPNGKVITTTTPLTSLQAGSGISVSGNTITNTMASSTITAGGVATFSPNITFGTSTDTNLLLSIVCASQTCTFNPTWTGTLADARIASAATWNAKQPAGNYITALTGDVTATGPNSVAATLATVNANVGSFGSSTAIPNFTVNGKGLITAAGTNVVIAPAGTLTGTTLASNVLASSLTSVGTLSALTVSGQTTLGVASGTALSLSNNLWVTGTTNLTGQLNFGSASGTSQTLTNLHLTGLTSTVLAVDPNGKVIATTTSAGGVTSVTATAPLFSSGGSTPNLTFQNLTANDILFGQGTGVPATSTSLTWDGTKFTTTNASTSALTVSGPLFVTGQTTLGNATATNFSVLTNFHLPSITGTQCLRAINGLVSGTGSDCGAGGGTNYWTTTTNGIYSGTNGYLVGINSSTPTANLTVVGSSTAPTIPELIVASSSNATNFIVDSAGRVGIGTVPTTTQSVALHIDNPTFARILLTASTTQANVVGFFDTRADTVSRFQLGTKSNHNVVVLTNDTTRLGIWASGGLSYGTTYSFTNDPGVNTAIFQTSVGINTTSPTATLVVQGTSGQTNDLLRIASSTGTRLLVVTSNGNVGIGSTSPTSQLVVSGTAGQTTPIFVVSSSSNSSLFSITPSLDTVFQVSASSTAPSNNYYFKAGKFGISSSSTPPTLSSCGTSPSVVGSNSGMVITVGSVAATACTATFNPPFTNSPSCTVTNRSMSVVNAMTYTVSNTAITVSQTGLTGDILDIHCNGIGE